MTQVAPGFYNLTTYDEWHRWISYWYQIQAIARAPATTALEIGCGSGVLSSYLRQQMGIAVTTFDFDGSLHPNVIGDVRHLASYFQPKSFDTVCAFQVLEHIPFADFKSALVQMALVSRKNVIISLPHWGYSVHMRVRLKTWQFAFSRKITRPFTWKFDGQHYWEIGTRGFSLNQVVSVVADVLEIKRRYFCPDYPYHYFFECQVSDSDS